MQLTTCHDNPCAVALRRCTGRCIIVYIERERPSTVLYSLELEAGSSKHVFFCFPLDLLFFIHLVHPPQILFFLFETAAG